MKRGKKLTSVDKANVLATSRLWRKTAIRIVEAECPELELTHMYAVHLSLACLSVYVPVCMFICLSVCLSM